MFESGIYIFLTIPLELTPGLILCQKGVIILLWLEYFCDSASRFFLVFLGNHYICSSFAISVRVAAVDLGQLLQNKILFHNQSDYDINH